MCHFFKVKSMNLRLGTTCTILEALTKWRSLSQVEILRINFWQEIPIVILWKCTNCGVRRLNRGIKRLLFEGQRHKSSRLSISPDIKLLKVKFFTGQVRPALGLAGWSFVWLSLCCRSLIYLQICILNHQKTHQTNPIVPWDFLGVPIFIFIYLLKPQGRPRSP